MIISASAGAGHDGASRELARRLRGYGLAVDEIDLADLFPLGIGRLLQGTYQGMVSRLPWCYGFLFALGGAFPGAGASTRALLRPVRARALRALPADTRAVVSMYPVVSQVLGPLRRSGRLPVPVVTYLTDFAVNPIWVSPGVDLHCAAAPATAQQAGALGAGPVEVVGRLVAPGFRPAGPDGRRRARERFGLPARGRLALLVAGSWGVGAVARTAREIAGTGQVTPVVVCGRNAALARRLRRAGHRYVLDWVEDMPELMRATDVLVENAGGLTALEAMASGVPIATYRPIPGHGRANAALMDRVGVVTWIRRRADLRRVLGELADGPRGRRQRDVGLALFRSDPAAVIAAVATPADPAPRDRETRRSRSGRRRRRRTGAALVAAAVCVLAWRGYARSQGTPGRRRGQARPATGRDTAGILQR
ncbi:UDP-N-acetylglucosamine--LPS N-acetylglucosamine transferase [Plantactinospora sp. KBS50]|uniref:MGDG synthase family glycosyltransferase n=1 Tax=Plantactinospora sp. KBS50 TaxID=2024580 RepID=UPI001E3E30AA|nr:UDP-N-acetylglucosamine--LPS N-acetylglucosamine transferase [Plantactinospora sp. KBS50]